MRRLSRRVIVAYRKSGRPQKGLAQSIGVHPADLCKWVNGGAIPMRATSAVTALCAELGIPAACAIAESEE
jgi:hypothetical protein